MSGAALAPAGFREKERVLVKWSRPLAGEHSTYAARVIQVRGEFSRSAWVQTECRVQYEIDGTRLWHPLNELSPLDEGEEVALPPECCDVVEVNPTWRELSLRCVYSFSRLTDPATLPGCTHPSCCNFEALQASLKRPQRVCPVAGCMTRAVRPRDVIRDDALREAITALPASAESCWLRGAAEVQLERP